MTCRIVYKAYTILVGITERSDFRKTKLSNFDFYFLRLMMVLLGRYFTCVYKVAATDRGPAIRRQYTAHPSVNHLRQTGARINKVLLSSRARQNLSST